MIRAKSQIAVPRPRGDQPSINEQADRLFARSPPARGSTARCPRRSSGPTPFPARAGINRYRADVHERSATVPRPRGDQPRPMLSDLRESGRSPPARGSTDVVGISGAAMPPFPARAGIDGCRTPMAGGAFRGLSPCGCRRPSQASAMKDECVRRRRGRKPGGGDEGDLCIGCLGEGHDREGEEQHPCESSRFDQGQDARLGVVQWVIARPPCPHGC